MRKLNHRSFGILLALGLSGGIAQAEQESPNQKSTGASSGQTSSGQTLSGHTSSAASTAHDQQSQIKEAAQMNLTAVRVAQLASQKGQNEQLKQYARTLQQDHQQAQKDLERIAQKQNVTLPTTLDAKCQEEISKLENLSSTEFDREFAKAAVEGHAKAIAKLQQTSGSSKYGQSQTSSSTSPLSSTTSTSTSSSSQSGAGSSGVGSSGQSTSGSGSSDWEQFNQRMLSKMQDHQRQAREVARAVGVDQSTITSLEGKARDHIGSPGSSVESSSSSTSQDRSGSSSSKQKSSSDQ